MNKIMKMKKHFRLNTTYIILIGLLVLGCKNKKEKSPVESEVIDISSNWKMQPMERLKGISDAEISKNDYDTKGWYDAVVPGTVLGSLVTTGVIEDPYFGINMQKVGYDQFKQAWWFHNNFTIDKKDLNKHISLRFNGINYRADLWVNGKKVVGKDKFAGTFKMFTFDITDYIKEGKNTIALKMLQRADGEYSIGFVDWNPLPRDRNMGIFREVFLEINDGIKIRSPFVYAKVDKETLDKADLFIQTEIVNSSNKPVEGVVRIDFEVGSVEKKVTVNANETLSVKFFPKEFKELSVKDVKLWWPNGMGEPNLYNLETKFILNNKVIDQVDKKYGIREIGSYLNKDENKVFTVNGKFVLIKGGGWVDDLLLQDTKTSVEAQLKYVKQMNLNTIRLEGFWGKDEDLYNLCDEYGIMIMIGWSCHWEWDEYLLKKTDEKYGGAVGDEDIHLLADSWKDQMLWLRNHPSIFVWMLGSDKLPAPKLERKYIDLFDMYDPSRPYVTSAGGAGTDENTVVAEVPLFSEISGATGMKMLGPYAYTPPVYWYTDVDFGGAYGFNTETCPGPNIPPLASLKRMLPEKSLWPIDKKYWEYHTGRNNFKTLDRYRTALNARYGKSFSVEEFAFKSQVINYELMRPMFEAFIANKPKSTGLIQWMLNSAWPEMYWQLYDTYLQPNGAFYGVKKACEPLHAIYRYGFDDIYIANEDLSAATDITVKINVYDINSKVIFSDEWKGDVKSNISRSIYKLPKIKNLTDVWFLDLRVYNKDNQEIDNNFYWLSLKKDVLDYEAAKKMPWAFHTPSSQYADFTFLNKLPKVDLTYDYKFKKSDKEGLITLNIKNPSKSIAFFVFIDVVDSETKKPILPIFWSDNYISLLPGEEKTLTANYSLENSNGKKPELRIKSWNVNAKDLK